MKKTLLILMLALTAIAVGAQNKKQIIWNNVQTGYSVARDFLKITNVAMYDDRTEVSFSFNFYGSRREVGFSKDISIYVNDDEKKAYKAKSATVIELDKPYKMTSDTLNFAITFEPVPVDAKMLTILDKKWGFVITNIRNADFIPEGITNTYWRNNATGDWLIGIAKHHLIFDSKVWDIESRTAEKGGYTIKTTDGKTVKIGKLKKGVRTIAIDGRKPVACSPIVTNYLPDYPKKDNRNGFVDTNFANGDSVTIVGWLKDMPPHEWKQGKEFKIAYNDIFTRTQESFYTKMDSLGRFTLKFPLLNTSMIYLDWKRTNIAAVVEPGKTYFFLNDFENAQKLFMGDDVRVQNELAAKNHFTMSYLNEDDFEASESGAMAYKQKVDSLTTHRLAELLEYVLQHPNISQRYIDLMTCDFKSRQAEALMQFRYRTRTLPQEYVDYVTKELFGRKYMLGSDYTYFMRYFFEYQNDKHNDRSVPALFEFLKEKGITFTDKENKLIEEFPEKLKNVTEKIDAAKTDDEKRALANTFNSSEHVTVIESLLKKHNEQLSVLGYRNILAVIDSVCGGDKVLRDICITQLIYNDEIINLKKSLTQSLLAFIDKEIQLPSARKFLMAENEKFRAFEQNGSNLPVFKSADNVAGMTDGEKILRRIIEPYKGKIILIDVWGTWCMPCKMALKNSQEEFEALKDYDIQYLYFANKSPEQSWKNVINEYKVTGDNVAHYNLPADQQSAVENFLKVHSFPSYRLIDADGNIIDMRVDARDLEGLKKLLNKMEKK